MQELVQSETVSPRIKFTIQNIIDLRTDNWIDRREQQGPMTIQKVHENAAKNKTQPKQIMRKKGAYEPILGTSPKPQQSQPEPKQTTVDDGWMSGLYLAEI